MTRSFFRSNKIRSRKPVGSMIVEGTVSISVLLAVIVPVLIFAANVAAQLILQAKVTHIANQAAEAVDEGKYWLGLPRPGFNQDVAAGRASSVATSMANKLGLPGASAAVSFDTSNADYDLTIVDVNVNAVAKIPFRVNVFGYDMAALFPGNVSGRGVASHAKITPYALIHMDAPHAVDQTFRRPLGFNDRDVAVIPAYGFFNAPVGGAPDLRTIDYGKGLAKEIANPENFFAMNHYHLKKSDVNHVLETGEDVQLSCWNTLRVINGVKELH